LFFGGLVEFKKAGKVIMPSRLKVDYRSNLGVIHPGTIPCGSKYWPFGLLSAVHPPPRPSMLHNPVKSTSEY